MTGVELLDMGCSETEYREPKTENRSGSATAAGMLEFEIRIMTRQGRRLHHQLRKTRGQISILIVFSFIPLFTLFAFVVNIGMLVNAKISLQNAADLAAYSGAAAQARQLSNISFLNYQMRQAYKKFLFKYYVLGNLSLRCYPRENPADMPSDCAQYTRDTFEFKNPGGLQFPGVPSVCITLSPDSNPCQLGNPVPVVRAPTCLGAIDPSCPVLQQAAQEIGQTQRLSCEANSVVNQEILGHWLYATDEKGDIRSQVALAGLVEGIGVVTETILLNERVLTTQKYINVPGQDVTNAVLRGRLENDVDPIRWERTIMAFKTATGHLNDQVFDHDTITMKEMLPPSGMLNMRPINPTFEAAYTYMQPSSNASECGMRLEFLKASPVIGVYKDPTSYVYYAVKLTARAKLLFNPFPFGGNPSPDIELTAYAAAAPFGSRVGPQVDEQSLIAFGKRVRPAAGEPEREVRYPRAIIDGDGETSWEHKRLLASYRALLLSVQNATGGGGSVAGGTVGQRDLLRGMRAAMLPDPFEVGKYNIPVDVEQDDTSPTPDKTVHMPYYRNARINAAGSGDDFTFWAPIHEQGAQNQFREKMAAELATIIPSIGEGINSTLNASAADLQQAMLGKIEGYLATLRERRRFNIAGIPDPLSQKFFAANGPSPATVGNFLANTKKQLSPTALATSYTTDHRQDHYLSGRVGYSVKFIPFKHLVNGGPRLANGTSDARIPSMANFFGPDLADLKEVSH